MLEITGKDISQLGDADLRDLIGLLCEAELRFHNLPIAGVTWGGHQNAPDGGIDVNVDVNQEVNGSGFIPKSQTGFQVKKPDLARQKIIDEMCKDDELKNSIIELIEKKGAYIIASGDSKTSEKMRIKRTDAMNEALEKNGFKGKLLVDYYDQGRIASWVRCHPSIVVWVREKIGRPISGWQSFKNWSKGNDDIESEFYSDDDVRIYKGIVAEDKGVSIIDGINQIRNILSNSFESVRLVGLSGVGKTRFLQALFDSRLGENALHEHQVIYTDIGQTPNPAPIAFAQWLVTLNQTVFLAIDNCPPELHSEMIKICCNSNSQVKLITIEYDIREGLPETTEVFRLEPISESLIEKIIQNQFRFVNSTNAKTIANFSGGNARIAYALARTLKRGDFISCLQEDTLFKRLFYLGKKEDNSLMWTGEVCSLVYSFNFETTDGKDEEMLLLANFAGKTILELHRDIVELQRRELVQQRNIWRAVLPHAIANRLASRALENIPFNELLSSIEGSTERLLKSFSHRLSYLHHHPIAQKIASTWLNENGFLGDLSNLNSFNMEILKNIALISPEATLNGMERAILKAQKEGIDFPSSYRMKEFSNIVSAIAYEAKLFKQSLKILVHFYFSNVSQNDKQWMDMLLETLFYIKHSRTHAPLEIRISVVKRLLESSNPKENNLGFLLLKGLLEASNMRPFHGYTHFGRKFNDFGYYPKTNPDVAKWFTTVLEFCKNIVTHEGNVSASVKIILANSFRGLWFHAHCGFYEAIENIAKLISKDKAWIEGWMAIRQTIRYDKDRMKPEQLERLLKLEKELKPKSLEDQVRAFAFANDTESDGLLNPQEEDNNARWKQIDEKAKELGKAVGGDEKVFEKLLPEMVTSIYSMGNRISLFCIGMATECKDPLSFWRKLKDQFASHSNYPNYRVLEEFLVGISERNSELSDKILDEALEDKYLIQIFPRLQSSLKDDLKRWKRLKQCLDIGKTPVEHFVHLGYANLNQNFESLTEILELLLEKEGGLPIVLEVLKVGVFSEHKKSKTPPDSKIKAFARKVLTLIVFDRNTNYFKTIRDFKLGKIIDFCFDEGICEEGKIVCENIKNATKDYKINLSQLPETMKSLARRQSLHFLDCFIGERLEVSKIRSSRLNDDFDDKTNPLSQIDSKEIIDWCEKEPTTRYSLKAPSIILFKRNEENNQMEFSDLALEILKKSPNVKEVLQGFSEIFTPSFYVNSGIPTLTERLPLLERLKTHSNINIREWAEEQEKIMFQEIHSWEQWDDNHYNIREERFE